MFILFWRGVGATLAPLAVLVGVGIGLLVKLVAGVPGNSGPIFTIFIGAGLLVGAGLIVVLHRVVEPRFPVPPPLADSRWKPPPHMFLGVPLKWLWIVPAALGLFLVVGSSFALG